MIIIKHRFILIAFIAVAVGILLIGREKTYNRDVYGTFDTVCNISVHSTADNTAEYEKMLRELDSELNAHSEDSIIARLNNGEVVSLSPEITELLCTAVSYTNMLKDYFDITVNPITQSWKNAEKTQTLPDDIDEKLHLVGADCINIDIDTNTARIIEYGASITLGAIAKGYAANVIADAMRKNGEMSALINLGGNVYALGKKPDGSDWKIAVCNPQNTAETAVTITCSDTAVVTSGDYERYFDLGSRRYHHILDPQTGYPAESGLRSATVIARDAELCDVLSTALFVAGVDKAGQICSQFGVDAILIAEDIIYYTEGLGGKIQLNNENYTLVPLKME